MDRSTESTGSLPTGFAVDNFSVIATRLMEVACSARDRSCEAVKAQTARAMALLLEEPSTVPGHRVPHDGHARELVRGSLALWKRRRLTAYIDAHLTERIRVTDLAELSGLSEGHFSRAFRCTFGTSAYEYVTRRRVEVAQSLMLTSREPLCEIALRCGLYDQSHFTRMFRRIVGETPYAWRRSRLREIEHRATAPLRYPTESGRVSGLSCRAEQQV